MFWGGEGEVAPDTMHPKMLRDMQQPQWGLWAQEAGAGVGAETWHALAVLTHVAELGL